MSTASEDVGTGDRHSGNRGHCHRERSSGRRRQHGRPFESAAAQVRERDPGNRRSHQVGLAECVGELCEDRRWPRVGREDRRVAAANHHQVAAQDADGVYYVKDRVALLKSKSSFWQYYKFSDPVSNKIAPKSTYCEKLNDTAVCVGIYK